MRRSVARCGLEAVKLGSVIRHECIMHMYAAAAAAATTAAAAAAGR